MKKSTSKRIRFDFTFSAGDVAYERLHLEMIQIANTHPNDPVEAAAEQKKHLLRILHAYSNSGVSSLASTTSFRTPEQAKQIAMSPTVPTLPPAALDAEVGNQATAAIEAVTNPNPNPNLDTGDDGLGIKNRLQKDGSYKFGNLYVD